MNEKLRDAPLTVNQFTCSPFQTNPSVWNVHLFGTFQTDGFRTFHNVPCVFITLLTFQHCDMLYEKKEKKLYNQNKIKPVGYKQIVTVKISFWIRSWGWIKALKTRHLFRCNTSEMFKIQNTEKHSQ